MRTGPPLPAERRGSLPSKARALILTLQAELAERRAVAQALEEHAQELAGRLARSSIDPPAVKSRPPHPPPDRRPGGLRRGWRLDDPSAHPCPLGEATAALLLRSRVVCALPPSSPPSA
jgi:hypothetical protein